MTDKNEINLNHLIAALREGPYRRESKETRTAMDAAADIIESMREHIADDGEHIVCNACGNNAGNDPLHFSGMVKGKPCNHIHLCAACAHRLTRVVIGDGTLHWRIELRDKE